jgi:SpoVK/Ycf46/Vps4 family AAA+-type ATPase
MEYFSIIQALCRSALSSPNNSVVHQIERLKEVLEKDGYQREAKSLDALLSSVNKSMDMAPSKIQRSLKSLGGEELTTRASIPVDKESSTPLAEIIFPSDLPDNSPLFNRDVELAIQSILHEWHHYNDLESIKADPTRTCLIYGAPGTGKTHLALWIAKQIGIPVLLARLDGLMSSFLGTTSRNIGNLFSFAAKYQCILLLDEFDAIAKLRNDPQEVGEIKRVVNTLLQNLDARRLYGFTIGVTNHESLLDPAIWRRFEVQIEIPKPSIEVVQSLITSFLKPLELDEIEIKFLTWSLEDASGADIESFIKWLKKSYILDDKINLVDQVRRFSLLNSGRIESKKRKLLNYSDEDLIADLKSDSRLGFRQKEIAQLLGKTESSISRQLSRFKETEKR